MTHGQMKDAERKALNVLDKWNDVSGAVDKNSSWYYELQAVVEDAVHIGVQMALTGEVRYDDDRNVHRETLADSISKIDRA